MSAPGCVAAAPVFDTVIVGTGFSGLCMAMQLRRAGRDNFIILEQAEEVGGTWRENHYPGCASDSPAHLYSFSFEPNPRWSRMFAPQAEILSYLRRCADKYQLRPRIRFQTALTEAAFDEESGLWRLGTSHGDTLMARYVVLGLGAANKPAYPKITGIEKFQGRLFHSACWDHSFDLQEKRVAVIGTGASAIQFIPQIAKQVDRLHVFQRTPQWILPKPDRPISRIEQRLFSRLPILQRLFRLFIYWTTELPAGLGILLSITVLRLIGLIAKVHIGRGVADSRLRKLVTPDYVPGCKRLLFSEDFYPCLTRPNVEVVSAPIAEITASEIVTTDGVRRPVDAIICATGFRITERITPIKVLGRGGLDIRTAWQSGSEAYLGTTISGFPNLFMLTGPNTSLGQNTILVMIEAQVDYILRCMRACEEQGARFMDVLASAQTRFNRRLQARLARSVWASGCASYYLEEDGRNTTIWPGFSFEFWARTRRVALSDYSFAPQESPGVRR